MAKPSEERKRGGLGMAMLRLVRRFWRAPRIVRWGITLVVLVVLFSVVLPVGSLVGQLLGLLTSAVTPLLETTVGRVATALTLLAIVGALAAWLLRPRWRRLRGKVTVGRFLQADRDALLGRWGRAIEGYQRVARHRGDLPDGFKFVPQRARLQVARIELQLENAKPALQALVEVDRTNAPRSVRREWGQLHVRALILQGEALPEAIAEEISTALEKDPDDPMLLELLRDTWQQAGRLDQAAEAQERRARLLRAGIAEDANRCAGNLWLDAARHALARGDLDTADRQVSKARTWLGDDPAPDLLAGDVAAAGHRHEEAVGHWGRTDSAEGILRIWNHVEQWPEVLTERDLLDACPRRGILPVVALIRAQQGDSDRAQRAIQFAQRQLGASPTGLALLAEVLHRLGRDVEARELVRAASA